VVICDRFIPDILVDLNTYSTSSSMVWLKFLSRCLPNPRVRLLLDVTPEVALERARDKDSLEFLRRQAELYNQTRRSLNLNVVDTRDEFKDTCNRIIDETLKTYYSKKCVVFGWEQDK
jgi:thymidylate kinase